MRALVCNFFIQVCQETKREQLMNHGAVVGLMLASLLGVNSQHCWLIPWIDVSGTAAVLLVCLTVLLSIVCTRMCPHGHLARARLCR